MCKRPQSPFINFSGKYSGRHDSAHTTADDCYRTDPDSETAVRVRKADEYCAELYKARQDALQCLEAVDKVYMDTWDAIYSLTVGMDNEQTET